MEPPRPSVGPSHYHAGEVVCRKGGLEESARWVYRVVCNDGALVHELRVWAGNRATTPSFFSALSYQLLIQAFPITEPTSLAPLVSWPMFARLMPLAQP